MIFQDMLYYYFPSRSLTSLTSEVTTSSRNSNNCLFFGKVGSKVIFFFFFQQTDRHHQQDPGRDWHLAGDYEACLASVPGINYRTIPANQANCQYQHRNQDYIGTPAGPTHLFLLFFSRNQFRNPK